MRLGWDEIKRRAKDIGKDVRKFATADYSRAQMERYKQGLPDLIYTNGTNFEFFVKAKSLASLFQSRYC